jgi:hypothetical protein
MDVWDSYERKPRRTVGVFVVGLVLAIVVVILVVVIGGAA